jgi:murein DD-endopeptidase MepM/ murein hydrolase activator NlpD
MTRGAVLWDNETFAVDLIRLRDGSSHSGDGTANEHYHAWGAPVLSSTAGTVVEVRDGLDSVPPGAFPTDLRSIDDAGGNHVMVRAARGVYVYYAHLQKGSISVRVGNRVRVGLRLGLLGNSGNTTGAHLHLQVSSGPDVFTSESLPYVFSSYVRQGTITVDADGVPTVQGPAQSFRRMYPVVLGVQTFR